MKNQTWEILLLVTVVTVSFTQMKIGRIKIRFQCLSNVKIMVTQVFLTTGHFQGKFFDFKIYNCALNIWQVMSDAMKGLRSLCSVKAEGKQDKLHDLELIKVLI